MSNTRDNINDDATIDVHAAAGTLLLLKRATSASHIGSFSFNDFTANLSNNLSHEMVPMASIVSVKNSAWTRIF